MKKTKAVLALLMAGTMMLGVVGCGSSSDTAGSGSATTGTESTGSDTAAAGSSDMNVMLETPVESLDPQQATDGTSFEVIADYTDGLMQMDADGQAVPAIAESYDLSDDGLTYTFHLRSDAKWSNGTPVTAADFVFAWQRAVDPAVASEYAYMLSDIGQIKNAAEIIAGDMDKSELGVTAVDDTTLQVELNVPVSYFLSLMYFPTFYPVNEEFFNSCGDTFATSPETTLSNGAFILDSYEPAATAFHLTKNADYYDAGRVQLSGLNYQVIQDSQQALMSYQTGALDTTLVNGEQVDQVKDDPEFKTVGAGYLWYVSPNMDAVPELANLNVRLALTMAIDRDAITGDVLKDGSAPTQTTLPGLTVNLVVEPKKQRVQDMQDGNYQLGLTRWGPDYADPMTYLGMWVSGNSNNYGLWSNADYDAIIYECTTGDLCTDAEGRWERLYDAEQIVMDEAVIFPLYTQCNAEMLSSKVTGVEYHPVALNRVYKDAVKTE